MPQSWEKLQKGEEKINILVFVFVLTTTQSCGLCPGMTRHPTNDCGDTSAKDCAKHAEDSCYQAHIAKECCLSCGLGR